MHTGLFLVGPSAAVHLSTEVWVSLILGAATTFVIAYFIYSRQKKESALQKQEHNDRLDELKSLHERDSEKIEILYNLIMQTQKVNISAGETAILEEKIRTEASSITEDSSLQAQALKAIAGKQDDEARRLMNEIASREHDLFDLYKLRALQETRKGDYAEAVVWRKKLLDLDPDNLGLLEELIFSMVRAEMLDDALKTVQDYIARLEREAKNSGIEMASACFMHGYVLAKMGQKTEAEPILSKAKGLYSELSGNHESKIAWISFLTGEINMHRGYYAEAEADFKHVLEIVTDDSEISRLGNAEIYISLANVYSKLERFAEAEEMAQKTLDILNQYLAPDHPRIAHAYNTLGGIYYDQKKDEQAEHYWKLAYEISLAKFGKDHPFAASVMSNLALIYSCLKKYAESIAMLEKVLEFHDRHFGPESIQTAIICFNLGKDYWRVGRLEESASLLERGLRLISKNLGEDNPRTASFEIGLALVYADQEKYEEAEELVQKAVKTDTETLGAEHRNTLTGLKYLADIYLRHGKYADAEAVYGELLPAFRSDPHLTPELNELLEKYASTLDYLGKKAEADRLRAEIPSIDHNRDD